MANIILQMDDQDELEHRLPNPSHNKNTYNVIKNNITSQ